MKIVSKHRAEFGNTHTSLIKIFCPDEISQNDGPVDSNLSSLPNPATPVYAYYEKN